MLNTLSGRFLILTCVFVMLAEIMIFVPSVARFREDYLKNRLERAQLASLALLADEMLDTELEAELLENAGVFNVVLRRDDMRQLVLSSPIPQPVVETFDLRGASAASLIMDAMHRLLMPDNQIIRVIGAPVREAGSLIEVTMETAPLRATMVDYGVRILILSAVISVLTALLLFVAVRLVLVKPIKGVVGHMQRFAAAPQDARGIIVPNSAILELREAEEALYKLQTELAQALKQRERLAQLGSAVAKISHDLRNILTSAQLFTDRIEMSEDPHVRRLAPKLVNSITRAVSLCEGTLAFGRAEEAAPCFTHFDLHALVEDVVESERLAVPEGANIDLLNHITRDVMFRGDQEQVFRIVMNLVRNARQAIETSRKPGQIAVAVTASEQTWHITIEDTGPGLPKRAQDNLFTAFQGGARKGGTGLGLVIAAELARGHGGSVSLGRTGPEGTCFQICLPKEIRVT